MAGVKRPRRLFIPEQILISRSASVPPHVPMRPHRRRTVMPAVSRGETRVRKHQLFHCVASAKNVEARDNPGHDCE